MVLQIVAGVITVHQNLSPSIFLCYTIRFHFPTSVAVRSGHVAAFYQSSWDRSGVTLWGSPFTTSSVCSLLTMTRWDSDKLDLDVKLKKVNLLPTWAHGKEPYTPCRNIHLGLLNEWEINLFCVWGHYKFWGLCVTTVSVILIIIYCPIAVVLSCHLHYLFPEANIFNSLNGLFQYLPQNL